MLVALLVALTPEFQPDRIDAPVTQVTLTSERTELDIHRQILPAESVRILPAMTESPPTPGTSVQVFLESPDGDLTLRAQVAQVLDAAKAKAIGPHPGVGLQITDLLCDKKQQLLGYIEGRRTILG